MDITHHDSHFCSLRDFFSHLSVNLQLEAIVCTLVDFFIFGKHGEQGIVHFLCPYVKLRRFEVLTFNFYLDVNRNGLFRLQGLLRVLRLTRLQRLLHYICLL